MTVIDEGRRHAVVDALYLQVDAVTPITVEFVEGVSWGNETQGGKTVISAGTAMNPAAALYHELLHADLKNGGYRQYSQVVPTNARIPQVIGLVEALDNELQHHRMFARFKAAGFPDEAFYSDDDRFAFRKTREELRTMNSKTPLGAFLLKLLTVIAPGGHGSADDRRKLRNFLTIKAGPANAARLSAIEAHILAWSNASGADPGATLKAIFDELDYDGGWVGASQNFPTDGFFTGAAFPLSAAEAYLRTIPRT